MKGNGRISDKRTFKGVVLVMVITVMFVLIIMLMATLSVVSTAKNRTYEKFEENQAYYTARSALDLFSANMLNDGFYKAYGSGSSIRKYNYTDTSVTPPVVKQADMKQGRALELELYKIKAHALTSDDYNAMSDKTQFNADKYYSNPVNGEIFDSGSPEEANYACTSLTGYVDYIDYTVTLPKVASSTDDYGKVVDADTSGNQIAKIRVEVLSRMFNNSGNYTADQIKNATASTTPSIADVKKAIKEGDRSKDKMRIRITSNVTFMGVEGSAVLEYDTAEKVIASASKAVTSLSDISQGSGLFPVGGGSSLMGDFDTSQDSAITGSLFIVGKFINASNTTVVMQPDTHIVALGGIDIENAYPIVKGGSGSFMYSPNAIKLGKDGPFGDATDKVNIIGGTVSFGSNMPTIYGNIFADNLDISSDQNGQLRLNGDNYANNVTFHTNFADVNNGSYTINLNKDGKSDSVLSGGKLTISGFVTIGGIKYQVISANQLKNVQSGDANFNQVYTASLGTKIVLDSTKVVNINYFNGDYYGNKLSASFEKEFTLPGNLAANTPSNKLVIPTVQSLYGEYFDPSDFVVETATTNKGNGGDFTFLNTNQIMIDCVSVYGNYVNPTQADADKALITSHIMSAAKKYNGGTTLNLQSAPVTTSAVTAGSQMATDGFTKCINSSGVLTSGYNYGNVAIDATTSNIELQLGNGTGSNFTLYGKFVVYGDKNVTILMPESSSGATINYYFGDTTSNNGVIMSRDLINSVSDLNNVNGGTSSYVLQLGKGGTSKAPKVNLFSGPKTNVILSTMSFVSGYFYSPDSTVTLAGGANGLKHNVNYSGYAIQNPSQIGFNIIGSVVCAKYGSNQKVGVAFINPNQNTTPAGDPLFNWNAAQYKRN